MAEFSMRVDLFRDLREGLSVKEAHAGKDYAGSMLKDGVRAACMPRVGEYVLYLATHLPRPFSLVTAVEHTLAGTGVRFGEGEAESEPSVIVVVTVPWPGDDVKDELVKEFEAGGWTWREASE